MPHVYNHIFKIDICYASHSVIIFFFCFKLLAVFSKDYKKILALFTSYLSFHVFIYSDLNLTDSDFFMIEKNSYI